MIAEQISTNQSEVAPSTGAFSYIPSASAAALSLRVNGGAAETLSIAANTSPAALAAALTGLSGVNAAGGSNRVITAGLSNANTIALSVLSGQNVNIALTAPAIFGGAPAVGDTLQIPSGSVLAGAGNANVGWYMVTGVANTAALAQISAIKMTAGAPSNVAAVALSGSPSNDIVEYSPLSINNLSGADRNVLQGLIGQNAAVTVSGSVLTFTLTGSSVFAAMPKIGDNLYIPAGSAFQGTAAANDGWYQVSAVSNYPGAAYISALRLSNGAPVAVSSAPIAAVTDLQDLLPQIRGVGKSMEIMDNGGAVNINTLFYALGTQTAASFIGQQLVSSAELVDNINLTLSNPFQTESFNVGGDIALMLGYAGTMATASIAVNSVTGVKTLSTTVVGGNGANLSINLSKYNSINDLVTFINIQPGYKAAAASKGYGSPEPVKLLHCKATDIVPGRAGYSRS